jgi:hypothetical protein
MELERVEVEMLRKSAERAKGKILARLRLKKQ